MNAIDFILKSSGTRAEDCDVIVYAGNCQSPIQLKIKRISRYTVKDYVKEMHEYWKPVLYKKIKSDFFEKIIYEEKFKNVNLPYDFGFLKQLPIENLNRHFNEERLRTISSVLEIEKEKIHFVDHHTAHANYAYFASNHENSKNAVIVTADSWGDGCNASIWITEKHDIKEIFRTGMCHLARMYRWITLLLGMKPSEHEYKVMGLAPYAKQYMRESAYKIFDETLIVDGIDFKWEKKPKDMYFHFKKKLEGIRFDGIAAGLQLWLEETLTLWITNIMKQTGAQELYFSGGLSMNVKANKEILKIPDVKNFYVPPSGGDESLSMGGAFYLSNKFGVNPTQLDNAYLGHSVGEGESENAIKSLRRYNNIKIIENPENQYISELLVKGRILARCTGKMEFGARALGNRSILCDPSKYELIRLINENVKNRDFWMPFTPSILHERADDYLVNPKGISAPYMTIAFDSTHLARQHLKAAIHPYDFTIRPQIVTPDVNPEYYIIIKDFERKTGIGALLNTSFNLHGQPIVCTAQDAVHTFLNSGLDGLILPGFLILKNDK